MNETVRVMNFGVVHGNVGSHTCSYAHVSMEAVVVNCIRGIMMHTNA